MTYQAFYRVYRPQSFREMSGQMHVKRTLQNALVTNKTTHAYLFSGPRGTGKTSTAKIFAKALNCEKAPTNEPCNECPACISITEGSHPDVIEFDAASNSRVEEMRDIIEKVRFAPVNARYKVYIIDEVHMLSTSAFNALLKTLEEPPAHAVFILATTEPHKLPATIISRCQRFDFKRLSSNDILERMKIILEDIELDYDEQALKVIAQAAQGGMRDALSLLDQVVSFSGEKLTVENALLVSGSVSQDVFYDLVTALKEKEIGKVLSFVDDLIAEGKDPLRLTEDLITFFRDLLLLQTSGELEELLELITAEEKFISLSKEFDADTLYGFIDILAKTQQEMRFSHHTKIYLETALLKMVQFIEQGAIRNSSNVNLDAEAAAKITQLEQQVARLLQQLKGGIVPANQAAQPSVQKTRTRPNNQFNAPVGRIKEVLKTATKQDIQKVKSIWPQVLSQLQKSQSALLSESEPVAASSSAFVLKFKYDIHCQMFATNHLPMLAQVISQLLGSQYEILCIPENQWLSVRESFIRENRLQHNKDSNDENEIKAEQPFIDDQHEIQEKDPLIAEAEKLFGDIVEVVDD